MTDSTRKAKHRSTRVRFAPVAVLGAVAASAAIALSMSGTLAGFVAQITNNNNTAATGTLVMQESQTVTVGGVPTTTNCYSSTGSTASNVATCSTINKYGGSTTMVPGTPVSTTITIKNTGSVPANTFTLAPGACTQSTTGTVNGGATDLCAKMTLGVTQDGTAVAAVATAGGTLSTVAGKTFTLTGPIAPNTSSTFVFTVNLPSINNTGGDNAYQGLKVSQDLVWQFTS